MVWYDDHNAICTSIAVPALTCSAPVSSNGVFTVTWSYIHTGGLPLTNVSVFYTYDDSSPIPVPVNNVATSSVAVSNVEAGFSYTFNITAENSIGSSSISCRPTVHVLGNSLS